ncbi:MAG: hypothetical protein ACTS73_05275 [Arsenophonus sp. NEOnobi-MAG3]
MIRRYISYIPMRHLKMVRYYSFLLNHKRGTLLPKVCNGGAADEGS